jgi:hypothetical protein
MKRFFFFFLLLHIVAGYAQSQVRSISSTVKNTRSELVPGANVQLLHVGDSLLLGQKVTDERGKFVFENLDQAAYLIRVTAVGYSTFLLHTSMDQSTARIVPVLILQPARENTLAEVVIARKRPLLEMEADKTVVNVEAMISSASSNTLEVLEKTPGVRVSPTGEISLNGRGGVLVLLDGRVTYLSASDLAAYLKSIPGASLDKIELMDNPSAKYDAAGNAVINIRLKKNRLAGFTGSVSTGYTQGKYGKNYQSLNLNYNYKKINFFANMGYTYEKNYTDDDYERRFYGVATELSSTVKLLNYARNSSKAINGNFGIDYAATPLTTYGLQLNLNEGRTVNSLSYLSSNFSAAGLDSTGSGASQAKNHRRNLGANMNVAHQFGKTGRELSADVNYLNYESTAWQSLFNYRYLGNGGLSDAEELFYDFPSLMHIYTLKADYLHPLKDKAKLEAGFKSSWVNNDNESDYYRVVDEQRLIENNQSNHFRYKENINAAYVNAWKDWKYWSMQLGMRVENTVSTGMQMGNEEVHGSGFKKNYTRLFPAVFLGYKLDTLGKNAFSFAVTRRINRPNYQLLNEFQIQRDQYSYAKGNSQLNPQYQYRYELKFQHRQLLRMGLSYNRFTNVIFQTTRVEGEVFITRPENVAEGYMWILNTGITVKPAKWWSMYNEIRLSSMGLNGKAYGVVLDPETYVARINVWNQFEFGSWTAELGGYYASADLNGQTLTAGMYRINSALQKKIWKGKGTIRVAADDILHSWIYHNRSVDLHQADYYQISQSDTQRFGIALSYRFGQDTFSRKSRHQNNALDEEKGRL